MLLIALNWLHEDMREKVMTRTNEEWVAIFARQRATWERIQCEFEQIRHGKAATALAQAG